MRFRFVLLVFCLLLPLQGYGESDRLPVYEDWGGDFTLTDQNGFSLSLHDFKGKVVLLTFGYTHCPDACPHTLFLFKNAINLLAEDAVNVQAMMITLDPQRDTAEVLKPYVEYFNPTFIGLTGSEQAISKIADAYGMSFEKNYNDSMIEYSIDHNGVIYLLDQQGRIRVFFKLNVSPERIAQDVRKLLAEK